MGMTGERAPICEMLTAYAGSRRTAFHVPGHKQRAAWHVGNADERYQPLLEWDVTELDDTDDLHHPTGPIAEAQRLAAECFGADETRLLVGGSTAGNLAMILGTAEPGDLLIVQRNAHRSIFHGLMLASARAVLLPPEIDRESGLGVIPNVQAVAKALARYPEARGVVLSSPNYYGMAGRLRPIAEVCHAAGVPLLVDEAHGPHFGFHPDLPPSAMQEGADLSVQSAHKMLSALTMGAMLHMRGTIVNREAVRQALRMVQSSSPSFPLLASLDLARRQLHVEGSKAFEPALEAVRRVKEGLPDTRFRSVGPRNDSGSGVGDGFRYDPLKLVLHDAEGRLDGFRIRDGLSARGCEAEMADARYVVLAFGIGSRPEDGDALIEALRDLSADSGRSDRTPERPRPMAMDGGTADIPEPVQFRRDRGGRSESVPLERSVGRTAAEWIIPYPPGIPELYPGEKINEAILYRLAEWKKQGANIQGAEDPSLRSVRVFLAD